ncbi:MAG: hypothetical protein ABMA15_20930 [Vicinamibacterales bacterium]
MENEFISGDIENVEHYLGELFHVPVGVCIADTEDIVRDVLGYEIADMRREPNADCVTGFQYVARIEWAPWNDGSSWRLMYALYRREGDHRSRLSKPVEEVERRPLLEMPIEVQRHAHHLLSQLVAAAGGEWQLLRGMMFMRRRDGERKISTMKRSEKEEDASRTHICERKR